MFDYFLKEKSDFLKKKDKSKKGHVDEGVKEILQFINSKKDYYTTSSCSGRIVLLEKMSNKKNEARWIFTKHGKVTVNEILNSLKNTKPKNEIWFKQEPLILHARCRNLDAAKKFLSASRKVFKRAGLISLKEKKIIIEVIGSERIDAIIAKKNFFAGEEYIKEFVKCANSNFIENAKKSKKFLNHVKNTTH